MFLDKESADKILLLTMKHTYILIYCLHVALTLPIPLFTPPLSLSLSLYFSLSPFISLSLPLFLSLSLFSWLPFTSFTPDLPLPPSLYVIGLKHSINSFYSNLKRSKPSYLVTLMSLTFYNIIITVYVCQYGA